MQVSSVYHQFTTQVEQWPQRPALVIQAETYTYADLFARVEHIRGLLRKSSLGKAPYRVGVYTQQHIDTYAALLAILGSNAAYVPVNTKFPAERNAQIIEDSGIEILLCRHETESLTELRSFLQKPIRVIYTEYASTLNDVVPSVLPEQNQPAYILFTSGSTGRPKGVPISHKNVNAFLNAVLSKGVYPSTHEDRYLQMFELTFDLSVYSFLAPMCVGACCCVVPEEGIGYFNILQTLDEQQITHALMVPSSLAYLRPYFDEIQLPYLKCNLFCGEALPTALALDWKKCIPNAQLENVYGPTEATIFCSRYVVTEATETESVRGLVPIGKPLDGVLMCLVNENNEPMPIGTEGELCLGGNQVTEGYWNNPERNAVAFIDVQGFGRMYKTGDLCRQNAQGDFLFLGRADQQVKIDGYRVELGDIEHRARLVTGVDQVVVVAKQNEQGTYTLHLFIENYVGDLNTIIAKLAQHLPAYMVPHYAHTLTQFPLNSNGKIDRKLMAGQLKDL